MFNVFVPVKFDVVLDKATMDSVLCGEGSLVVTGKCLAEISRVLAPEGVFICISHGQPSTRLQIFDKAEYGWSVQVETIAKPMLKLMKEQEDEERVFHYIYICKKKG